MTFDVLISGGTVVDGTGQPGFPSDVWIKGKKIAHVGNLSGATAARVIDATGLTVSPGFIDAHAHSDGALLVDGQHANGIRQGITTEIICPDGLGYPPLSPDDYRMYRHYLSGILGLPPEDLDMSSMAASKENYHRKTSCNVAAFIGHGPVRLNAAGMQDVPLRGETLETAKRLVRESLEQGAVGFATGLSYFPHTYSDTDELVEFCKVTAEFDLPLSIHLRNHNTDRGFAGGGVEEAMEIGRRSGVMVHLEHYRTQADSAGKIDELLEPVERAKADGVDVTLECYPYPVGSSFPCSFFPGPFHEGGPEAILERLRDDDEKATYVRILEETPVRALAGNAWTWIGSETNKHLEGMAWEDAAELRGESIGEMVCNVMLEEKMICGFRGCAAAERAVVAAGRRGHHEADLAARLHGRLGRHSGRRHGAPAGIRLLPQVLRQAAAQVRLPSRTDNPAHDAKPGAAVRTEEARRDQGGLLRRPGPFRR